MKKVLVFGVFDGVHDGHLSFLKQARECGDYLIVAVAQDEVIQALKGRGPLKELKIRKQEVKDTKFVDEVIDGDTDLGSWGVIGKVKPNVIALGYDQEGLRGVLERALKEKGLDIEIVVMGGYRPDKLHSSILSQK
ncbi:FAD synthase [bacterium]|nr:FAD synthase [bacterium]|tara:strand:- start:2743 stop:3150 length:408 start_codon:yes stop_codon:yes gene_type:complete